MNLREKYGDQYQLIAALREYVEEGIIMSDFNFWHENIQGLNELDVIKNRDEFVLSDQDYASDPFVIAFIKEDFPSLEEDIPDDIIEISINIISEKEGKASAENLKVFLADYALEIAKSSKESWAAYFSGKGNVSEAEQNFIAKLNNLLHISS